MNPDLQRLHPYPFEKLAKLKAEVSAPSGLEHIALSIGEPKHQPPQFVLDVLRESAALGQLSTTKGLPNYAKPSPTG